MTPPFAGIAPPRNATWKRAATWPRRPKRLSVHFGGGVNGLNFFAAACVFCVEMMRYLPLSPFVAAFVLLSCAKADPVADNAVAPSDELLGDASAAGLAAPANASAAEAVEQAALPASTDGMTWAMDPAQDSASFGPAGNPAFTVRCQKQREGPSQLVFIRHRGPSAGGKGTLSFTGNGQAASAPVSAVSNPQGVGGEWRSVIDAGDTARDIAETFNGTGPVNVSISGVPPLVVPAGPVPRRVFADCLGG